MLPIIRRPARLSHPRRAGLALLVAVAGTAHAANLAEVTTQFYAAGQETEQQVDRVPLQGLLMRNAGLVREVDGATARCLLEADRRGMAQASARLALPADASQDTVRCTVHQALGDSLKLEAAGVPEGTPLRYTLTLQHDVCWSQPAGSDTGQGTVSFFAQAKVNGQPLKDWEGQTDKREGCDKHTLKAEFSGAAGSVAKLDLGLFFYAYLARHDGKPAADMSLQADLRKPFRISISSATPGANLTGSSGQEYR